jgi:hypothetical protein
MDIDEIIILRNQTLVTLQNLIINLFLLFLFKLLKEECLLCS